MEELGPCVPGNLQCVHKRVHVHAMNMASYGSSYDG